MNSKFVCGYCLRVHPSEIQMQSCELYHEQDPAWKGAKKLDKVFQCAMCTRSYPTRLECLECNHEKVETEEEQNIALRKSIKEHNKKIGFGSKLLKDNPELNEGGTFIQRPFEYENETYESKELPNITFAEAERRYKEKIPLMQEFTSGAKRSKVMPRYDLISAEFMDRVATVWGEGCKKYGEYNWQKGGDDFIRDIPNHIIGHIFAYISGDTSEDHLANIICNCQMLMFFGEKKDE